MSTNPVVASTTFQLVTPRPEDDTTAQGWATSVPVPVSLRFDLDDPFAVHLVFATGPGREVRWVFARELLREGLLHPVGGGDVRVWPSEADTDDGGVARDAVLIELTSPSGQACFEASATELARFLDRTLALVPAGAETDLVDVDAALTALLAVDGR